MHWERADWTDVATFLGSLNIDFVWGQKGAVT